ncbi:MAG: tetratricopeptide repeat protein [Ardenticatenaceae bacterium]
MYPQISPNSASVALSAENAEIIDQLVKIIDFAEGLTILFARCNVPILRQALAAEAIRHLAAKDITVVVVEWAENMFGLRDHLRQKLSPAITSEGRLVVFVYGLEQSIPSNDPYPPILAELNMGRELFHRDAPYPIVFWLPDYALTALARGALDFWAWRSGVFEFETESIYREQALQLYARQDANWLAVNNMTAEQKRRRRRVLENLLADYESLPIDTPTLSKRAEILFTLGQFNQVLADYKAAHRCYQQSMEISEKLANRSQVGNTLHQIGTVYLMEEQYQQARTQYQQSLAVAQEVGNRSLQASALQALGYVHYLQKEYQEAQSYYEQSRAIAQQIGDQSVEASTLYKLGGVQFALRKYALAYIYYEQALMLSQQVGGGVGIGQTLYQLGALSQAQGQYEQARTHYEQARNIFQKLGARSGIAYSLALIGLLFEQEGDLTQAVAMLAQALVLFEQLGTSEQETIRRVLTRLQAQMGQEAFMAAWQAAFSPKAAPPPPIPRVAQMTLS